MNTLVSPDYIRLHLPTLVEVARRLDGYKVTRHDLLRVLRPGDAGTPVNKWHQDSDTHDVASFCFICGELIKLHMLHSHLEEFKDNMGAYSEEQGERFRQDVMDFEQRY
ncbi:hypothetical protein EVAR_27485_1 [Eumeta japonica]|uniref:Uncharacterized protein n=1 Tax=Eumeta variegata TaxID=151549 RepID=A0A4C1XDU0_EUMVA|nr:hypothetical protein EVAR_27485_1 [Eumeta japonica]